MCQRDVVTVEVLWWYCIGYSSGVVVVTVVALVVLL